MAKRSRPKIEDMDGHLQHSYDHRGDTGKYGDIYTKEVERWRKIAEAKHELCVVPYLCRENSIFRTANPDFNRPFDDDKLKNGDAWAHKLTVLLHYGVGINKDTVVCPRTWKADCPICEERNVLFDIIDKETDKDKAAILQKQADNLGTTKRALYNVFIFSSEKEMKKGVQVWEAPHESIEDVLSDLYVDERSGEKKYYTIPEEGWNVEFERKGTSKEGTRYMNVKIVKRLDKDEFSDKELGELYGMAYNLDEIVERKAYDELKEIVKGYASDGEVDKDEERSDRFRGRGEEEKQEEEKPDRFRGRKKEEEKELNERAEAGEDVGETGVPDKYEECFGIMNSKRSECEECPKEVWQSCYKESEKKKEPSRVQRGSRVGRRSLG